jgi:uncharacterized protein (TIGR02246 family)
MIDIERITAVYRDYGTAFDQGCAEHFADLFTPAGSLTLPSGHTITGRDGLRRLAQRAADGPASSHHFVFNLSIAVDGNRAEGTAHAVAVAVSPPSVELLVAGTYRDTLIKTPEGWKFQSRTITELTSDGRTGG